MEFILTTDIAGWLIFMQHDVAWFWNLMSEVLFDRRNRSASIIRGWNQFKQIKGNILFKQEFWYYCWAILIDRLYFFCRPLILKKFFVEFICWIIQHQLSSIISNWKKVYDCYQSWQVEFLDLFFYFLPLFHRKRSILKLFVSAASLLRLQYCSLSCVCDIVLFQKNFVQMHSSKRQLGVKISLLLQTPCLCNYQIFVMQAKLA